MFKTARILSLCGFLLSGCGESPAQPEELLPVNPTMVRSLKWNAKDVPTGNIFAVSDLNEDTVVFSDQGAMVFTAGIPLVTDSAVRSWRTAAVVPAGDLAGSWLVAVDGTGHVRRLRDRSVMEDVSDRYGLLKEDIQEVIASDPQIRTVFALPQELAVSDGQKVSRFSLSLRGISGGSGRVVGFGDTGVTVFQPNIGSILRYPLEGAVATQIDTAGRVIVATSDALYRENQRQLVKVYSSKEAPIRGLALSSGLVWVQVGDGLAILDEKEVRVAPSASLPVDGKLLGSSSGDVWILSQGKLSRYAEDTGGGAPEDQWKATVQPVFTRLCSLCHMPGGSADLDLSTYKSWDTRRDLMMLRVVDGKPSPMPPKGAGTLTQDELSAVRNWINGVQ